MQTREELESKIAAQQDVIEYAVNAAQAAKHLLDLYVPQEMKKEVSFRQVYAVVESIAKQDGFTGPRIAAYAHRTGLLEAAEIGVEVAKRGNEEWKAGAETVVEEIRKKAGC